MVSLYRADTVTKMGEPSSSTANLCVAVPNFVTQSTSKDEERNLDDFSTSTNIEKPDENLNDCYNLNNVMRFSDSVPELENLNNVMESSDNVPEVENLNKQMEFRNKEEKEQYILEIFRQWDAFGVPKRKIDELLSKLYPVFPFLQKSYKTSENTSY